MVKGCNVGIKHMKLGDFIYYIFYFSCFQPFPCASGLVSEEDLRKWFIEGDIANENGEFLNEIV